MRSKYPLLPLLLVLLLVPASTVFAHTDPESLAKKAVSADAKESAKAIAALRALGPDGLSALFRVHADEINHQLANGTTSGTPEWHRLSTALDTVSQQKDSYLSGLYWYTDLSEAKAAARTSGKPILSLRLLGKLSEEFSCANSRFFRTILYSNENVSQVLRERFILHWQSVRPAPHVTIDYGDGRKLQRTLTGNSIHYILDSDGRPFDALPGLYGPAAFLRSLMAADEALKRQPPKSSPGQIVLVQPFSSYHRTQLGQINTSWLTNVEKIGGQVPQGFVVVRREDGTPTALEAASLAVAKMVTESSMLKSMTAGAEALGSITDEVAWRKIAARHLKDAQLDARSIALIRRQTQKVFTAEETKVNADEALAKLVKKLEMHIALDTVRNEYLFRTKLLAWLITDPTREDLNRLNEKVYTELFLTPASDPWLGLFEPDTYVALEDGGISR